MAGKALAIHTADLCQCQEAHMFPQAPSGVISELGLEITLNTARCGLPNPNLNKQANFHANRDLIDCNSSSP